MKRIMAFGLVLLIVMTSFSMTVSASFENVICNIEGNTLAVSGNVTQEGKAISVRVLRPDATLTGLPSSGSLLEQCAYVGTIISGESGSFDLAIPLDNEFGTYEVKLSAIGMDSFVKELNYENPLENNAVKVYIAQNGSDTLGNGTIENPFATFNKAKAAVLPLMTNMSSNIEIIFRGGTYRYNNYLDLSNSYSGKNGYKLIVKSYEGEEVNISFSRTLTGWTLYNNGIYYAAINPGENPMSLYEEGKVAFKARTPNIIGEKPQYHRVYITDTTDPFFQFFYKNGDLPNITNTGNLQIFLWPGGLGGHYNWSTQLLSVAQYDMINRKITIGAKATYEMGAGSRYYLQGAMELLDAPGEFYTDTAANRIYYKPYRDLALLGGVELPTAVDGFYINGTAASPVSNIVIDGLNISNIDHAKKGIRLNHAVNVEIKNCQLYDIGHRGVTIEGYSNNNKITNNYIHHTGSDGIAVQGITGVPEKVSYGNLIENNKVQYVGRFDGNAGCIRVYDAAENVIRYNKVSETPRYGIHLKGNVRSRLIGTIANGVEITAQNVRNYQKTKDNIIEFNDVSNTMNDSQDCGAIATWGINIGNIIRNNYIHSHSYAPVTANTSNSFAFAIYNDEDSDGVVIENNLITGIKAIDGARISGILYPRGIGVVVRNNYIVDNSGAQAAFNFNDTLDNSEGVYGCGDIVYYGNIVDDSGNDVYKFEDRWTTQAIAQADYNIIKNPNNIYTIKSTSPNFSSFDTWKNTYGYDNHSIHADPGFMNKAQQDYRLSPNSAVFTNHMPIQELDQMNMGLQDSFPYETYGGTVRRIFARVQGEMVDTSTARIDNSQSTELQVWFRDDLGYLHSSQEGNVSVISKNKGIADYENGVIVAKATGVAEFEITVTYGAATKSIVYYVDVAPSANLRIENEFYQKISEIGSTQLVRAAVDDSFGGIVILAFYNANRLIKLVSTNEFNTDLVEVPQNTTAIKAMLVDSFESLMPICESNQIQ